MVHGRQPQILCACLLPFSACCRVLASFGHYHHDVNKVMDSAVDWEETVGTEDQPSNQLWKALRQE